LVVIPPDVKESLTVPPPMSAAVCAGAVAEMVVGLIMVTFVAGLPSGNVTDALPAKLVPVKVSSVPPAAGPLFGLTDVRVGTAAVALPVENKQTNNARIAMAAAADDLVSRGRIMTQRP
jgi:hypothetical protein